MHTWSAVIKGTDMKVVWNKCHLVGMRAQSLIALRSILLWEAVWEGYFLNLLSVALNELYTQSIWKTKLWIRIHSFLNSCSELSFIAKTEVKIQDLRNHISFIFWWQWERNGSRKGTIQEYFANPKKYSESISFRQIAFEKFVKSTKQIQIRDFPFIYRALKL